MKLISKASRVVKAGGRCLSTSVGKKPFSGVFPIMATPFHSDESLDLSSFRKSIRFMEASGVDGITIIGVLGESNRLTDRERETLIRAAIETTSEGFPILVGTSHAGTAAVISLSQMAHEMGASGVMVAPSKEAVPLTADGMLDFYSRNSLGYPRLPSSGTRSYGQYTGPHARGEHGSYRLGNPSNRVCKTRITTNSSKDCSVQENSQRRRKRCVSYVWFRSSLWYV